MRRGFATGITAQVFTAALASVTKALARVMGVLGMKFKAAAAFTPVCVQRYTYKTPPSCYGYQNTPYTSRADVSSTFVVRALLNHSPCEAVSRMAADRLTTLHFVAYCGAYAEVVGMQCWWIG